MSSDVAPAEDPAAEPPAVELLGLTRRFGPLEAVRGLTLQVAAGTSFGFLGPNGAGKSTTLRMLTGLLPPTSGDARIAGLSIREHPVAVKRLIGVVPDDLALFDRLTFWEHLLLVGMTHGLGAGATQDRAEQLLSLLGLWDARGTHAVEGSHGMRKKLALAMALIHAPRVLFLDEPFEGIDPIAGRTLRDLLLTLTGKRVTIFLTSHILEVVERLCGRVAVIANGSLAADTELAALRASGTTLAEFFTAAVGAEAAPTPDLPWLG